MLSLIMNVSTEFFARICFSLVISSDDYVAMKMSST